jgi:hypothetical protein
MIHDYLSMGWPKLLMDGLTVLCCVLVLFGCVCRVNMLNWRKHQISWVVLYTMISAFAMGLAVDILTFAASAPSWYAVVGVSAGLLHLWNTWSLWRDEPPNYTEKGYTKE